ncbi:MAG: hypothetical protein ACRD0P_39375, partial [Stackebrandtia sp.]
MKILNLIEYRHPSWKFSLPLPPGWELAEDVNDGVAMVARQPAMDRPIFRANIVVTVDTPPPGVDLDTWQTDNEAVMPEYLPNYLLLDRERLDDGRYSVYHRLAHHEAGDRG